MGKKADSSVWTAEKGQPPREPDDASATPTPKPKAVPKPKKPEAKGIRGGVWTEDSGVPVPQEPETAMAKGGSAKYMKFSDTGKPLGMVPVTKMAKGGSASARADGIAQRGKTRGTLVACGGGRMKK